ncbi:hypothetical protein ABMA28_003605 [Loxostege sticticalis]|uniref:SWIM-type domain-containing protein n=1 Tax=Loxostege sticticalis TaxID=481309 RepID=A0ABD0SWL7_LOXSC
MGQDAHCSLAKIDTLMVGNLFALNPGFCSAELKNVKTSIPEHKVRSKQYTVSVIVNEEEEKIISALCEDCPAAAGGCKHAIAFLFWLCCVMRWC